MARNRTLAPHTHNRPLYALRQSLHRMRLAAVLVVLGAANGYAQPAPCAPCLRISILAGQILLIPHRLEGAHVLIRVPAGTAPDVWAPALAALQEHGARAGLHVVGLPAPDDAVLTAQAATFAFEPSEVLSAD